MKLINELLKKIKEKKGAALVEYGLLISGIALVSMASVSIMGHKTTDLFSATAAVLPGAHPDDNGSIVSGKLVETTGADAGPIGLDSARIATEGNNTHRLGINLGFADGGEGPGSAIEDLVVEAGAGDEA